MCASGATTGVAFSGTPEQKAKLLEVIAAKKDEPTKPTVAAPDAIAVTNTPPVEQAPKISDSERAILERQALLLVPCRPVPG